MRRREDLVKGQTAGDKGKGGKETSATARSG